MFWSLGGASRGHGTQVPLCRQISRPTTGIRPLLLGRMGSRDGGFPPLVLVFGSQSRPAREERTDSSFIGEADTHLLTIAAAGSGIYPADACQSDLAGTHLLLIGMEADQALGARAWSAS